MNTPILILTVVLLLALSLFLVSCSSSNLIVSLQLVTDAVEVALPVLQAAGVDPVALAQAQTYLTAVSTAISQTSTELASKDTTSQKIAAIVGYFAAAGVPQISNPRVAAVVQAVAAAIKSFLASLQSTLGTPAQLTGTVTVQTGAIQPNFGERRKLASIKAQAEKQLKVLAGLQH